MLNTGNLPATAITINGGQTGTTLIQADPPIVLTTQNVVGLQTHLLNVEQSISAPISAVTLPSGGNIQTLNTTTGIVSNNGNNTVNTNTISAITAGRTLYGTATTVDEPADSDAAVSYMVRPVASGEIDATIVTDEEVGVSGARAGLTDAIFGAGLNEHTHNLRRGSLLVAPEKDKHVETAFGQVDVAAGAVALIVSTSHGTAIYNMDDAKSGSVVVNVGAEMITLAPGPTCNYHFASSSRLSYR